MKSEPVGFRTLAIRREGSFLHFTRGKHKCGNDGNHRYHYRTYIRVRGFLKPPLHFIVDNNEVHATIVKLFPGNGYAKPWPGTSCEVMAGKMVEALLKLVQSKKHWDILEVRVELTGSQWESSLECCWTKGITTIGELT